MHLEIEKINDSKYIVESIEVSRLKRKNKCVWFANGFLTKKQFNEFLRFIKEN